MPSGRYYPIRQNNGDTISSVASTQSVFSDNSTSTSASAAGSLWSGGSVDTSLTIPPHPTFVGIHGNIANAVLPCEFEIYTQCMRRFSSDEEDEWIIHHIQDHLGNKLPKRLRCPLCDDWVFDSHKQRVDRDTNFWTRMRHWAGHYTSGEEVGPMRRDHFMIKHLGDNGIIARAQFGREMGMSEMRPEIREPIEGGARPHNFVPPRVLAQRRRENQVVHSLDVEERKRRRKSGR